MPENSVHLTKEVKLTEKEKRFVQEYFVDLNATRAAIRAKYGPKHANRLGWELLQKPHIIQAINQQRPKTIQAEAKKYQADRSNHVGYIYLVQAMGSNYYKIGRTINIDSTLKALQSAAPFQVEYVTTIQVLQSYEVKINIAQRYKANLVRGEWYEFSPEQLIEVIAYLDSPPKYLN